MNNDLISNDFRFKNTKTTIFGLPSSVFLSIFFVLYSLVSFSQVTSSIDSTSIKIGGQITYKIEVKADTTDLVVFPEGQTFTPLEVIESYKIDTTKNDAKYNLIKRYGLTQFDSGSYTIPQQKIVIGTKVFKTDSLQITVNNIVVDTTKQGLYDIKPFIAVTKSSSDWWKTALVVLVIIVLIGFLLYWLIWRKKQLTEDEKIALLPPYDRAKLALQKLDDSHYLEQSALKEYYSELTFIIRKYLDEKVYDRALESTTDELINRLNLLKDGNQIDISKADIINLERILKRADLVKFAKSAPDVELAKLDRNTIDVEIDHVKEALPEPTEEDKLQDEKYKEELERKNKRKKVIITVAIACFLLIATFIGFGLKYGFTYVKDTLIGHESKELLEGEWVTSDYGVPPIQISTPKVLRRNTPVIPEKAQAQMSMTNFQYGSLVNLFNIHVTTVVLNNQEAKEQIDLIQAAEKGIKQMEAQGVSNILVKQDKFVTPNNAEGLKTSGSASFPIANANQFYDGEYVIIQFSTPNVLHSISITWQKDDAYAQEIVDRIINSIELKKEEE